jgi:hypothetical protein
MLEVPGSCPAAHLRRHSLPLPWICVRLMLQAETGIDIPVRVKINLTCPK